MAKKKLTICAASFSSSLISAAHRLLNFWNTVCLAIRTPRTKLLWADGTTAATATMGDLPSRFRLSSKLALLSGRLVCCPFTPHPTPLHTELGLGLVKHTIRVRVHELKRFGRGKGESMHALGRVYLHNNHQVCAPYFVLFLPNFSLFLVSTYGVAMHLF